MHLADPVPLHGPKFGGLYTDGRAHVSNQHLHQRLRCPQELHKKAPPALLVQHTEPPEPLHCCRCQLSSMQRNHSTPAVTGGVLPTIIPLQAMASAMDQANKLVCTLCARTPPRYMQQGGCQLQLSSGMHRRQTHKGSGTAGRRARGHALDLPYDRPYSPPPRCSLALGTCTGASHCGRRCVVSRPLSDDIARGPDYPRQ